MSQGFDSFRRKNNMLNEEELRNFVFLYQKRENLSFEKLKKTFLLLEEPLVDYMRIFEMETGNVQGFEEQSFTIVEYEKLK
jgi:hypothetical protein